jgi:hypothetical protein
LTRLICKFDASSGGALKQCSVVEQADNATSLSYVNAEAKRHWFPPLLRKREPGCGRESGLLAEEVLFNNAGEQTNDGTRP